MERLFEIEVVEIDMKYPPRTPETLPALIATLEQCLVTLDQLALHEAAARCDEVLTLCRLARQAKGERM